MTVVAYPKKDAITCMMARDKTAPENTVIRECFIALNRIIKSRKLKVEVDTFFPILSIIDEGIATIRVFNKIF